MTQTNPPSGADGARALTVRALAIGAAGSALLTASSLFIALKMGALPWPIVFAALASVVALRALGSRDLHEANVCHAAMSAGAMVAGGLAFTVPGLWMLGGADGLSLGPVLAASLGGTALGLCASRVMQPYFIRQRRLAYPIGQSAADTLRACDRSGAKDAKALFGSMGAAGAYALLRDNLALMPQVFGTGSVIPGVTLGVMNSPMLVAMGFTVGPVPAAVWFLGACIGSLGILGLLPALGVLSAGDAVAVQSSLGLGLMLGVGAGAIVSGLAGQLGRRKGQARQADPRDPDASLTTRPVAVGLVLAAVAGLGAWALGLGLLPTVVVICGAWFASYLSAWLTGTTGVNPMEVFGVLVLLLVQVLFREVSLEGLFLGAAVVAVACGIVGDVMNDLKAGDVLATDPDAQFWGMAVGGVVGAVVAPLLLMALLSTYGAAEFGSGGTFVAAQASVVATMAGGIPAPAVFFGAMVAGLALSLAGLPVMTLGLGVYLPFYMGASAGLGAVVRVLLGRWRRGQGEAGEKDQASEKDHESRAQAVASGILGGESLVGVLTALVAVGMMLAGA